MPAPSTATVGPPPSSAPPCDAAPIPRPPPLNTRETFLDEVHPVHERLRHVIGLDLRCAVEVRDRPRDLERPVEAAAGERHAVDGPGGQGPCRAAHPRDLPGERP